MPIFQPYKPAFVETENTPIEFETETQLALTETFQQWVRRPEFQGFKVLSNAHPSKRGELLYTVVADLGGVIYPVGFTETALTLEYVVRVST